jgi:hypothetical protein
MLVATEELDRSSAPQDLERSTVQDDIMPCRFPMISRLIAQMNADSSRAIAVAADHDI